MAYPLIFKAPFVSNGWLINLHDLPADYQVLIESGMILTVQSTHREGEFLIELFTETELIERRLEHKREIRARIHRKALKAIDTLRPSHRYLLLDRYVDMIVGFHCIRYKAIKKNS